MHLDDFLFSVRQINDLNNIDLKNRENLSSLSVQPMKKEKSAQSQSGLVLHVLCTLHMRQTAFPRNYEDSYFIDFSVISMILLNENSVYRR